MYRAFFIAGVICLIAIGVNVLLFACLLVHGPGRVFPTEFANFVLAAWIVATGVGLLASAANLVSSVLLLLFRGFSSKHPRWPLIFVSAALAFVPLNFLIAQGARGLEKVHRVTVINESRDTVTSLRLSGGIDHEFGPLPPAVRRSVKFRIQREGKLIAIAEVNGQTSQLVLADWVHPQKGPGRDRTIIVMPDGDLQVRVVGE
jgi:hypothetical protein